MTDEYIVIVVSDKFVSAVKGVNLKTLSIPFPHFTLRIWGPDDQGRRPERHWTRDQLRDDLQIELRRWPSAKIIRIVAHMTTCFDVYSERDIQRRIPSAEEDLAAATGIDDIQVWGFRHENGASPIWNVLSEIAAAIRDDRLSSAAPALSGRLTAAFIKTVSDDIVHTFNLCEYQLTLQLPEVAGALELLLSDTAGSVARETELEHIRGKFEEGQNRRRLIFQNFLVEIAAKNPTARARVDIAAQQVLHRFDFRIEGESYTSTIAAYNSWSQALHKSLRDVRSALGGDPAGSGGP